MIMPETCQCSVILILLPKLVTKVANANSCHCYVPFLFTVNCNF